MYVGISVNRLEDYNVSFKFAYNKKVYSIKRVSVYFKGSSNFKVVETDQNKKTIENMLMQNNLQKLYIAKSQLFIEEANARENIVQEKNDSYQDYTTNYTKGSSDFKILETDQNKKTRETVLMQSINIQTKHEKLLKN